MNGLCPRCVLAAAISDDAVDSTSPWLGRSDGPFEPPSVAEMKAKFPQLQITELVGTGGMGAVYRALQPGLNRVVAVKILPAERGRGSEFFERFAREAKMLAMLNHPNIVAVYDFGQKDDLCYIVMEFVEGTTLRNVIHSGQTKPDQALAIISQVSSAIQYAHEQGIVHRDIKPENILIDLKGRVKIADFGLAKLTNRNAYEGHLTRTQQVMGTLRYMAPEQIERTRDVDHRADIYSLGVVLYELLTRELPLGRFPLPTEKLKVGKGLDQIVLRALEKSPDSRYQFASQIRSDIEAYLAGSPVGLDRQVRDRLKSALVTWPAWIAIGLVAFIVTAAVAPVLIVLGVFAAMGYAAYRWLWPLVRSRQTREKIVDFGRSVPRVGFVRRLARFVWRYNPIAIAFRALRSRTLWVAMLALVCIGLYIGFWWPAWESVGRSKDEPSFGPGLIDREVWPFVGAVSSSVRIRPTDDLYESLTITLDLQGEWSGFDDAQCALAPSAQDDNRLTLKLETVDGTIEEMVIDNSRGGSIYFGTLKDFNAKFSGPADMNLVRRWLQPVIKDKDKLERHAEAIFQVLTRATDRNPYQHQSFRSRNNRYIPDVGRMARVVGATNENRTQSSQRSGFVFKEWTGRQTVDVERKNDNFILIGVGSTVLLFVVGYLGLRRLTSGKRVPTAGATESDSALTPEGSAA